MIKEVICITENFEPQDEYSKLTPDPKKGDICQVLEYHEIGEDKFYVLAGYPDDQGYDVECFADFEDHSEEIREALSAPNPDYRIEKLCPEELQYAEIGGNEDNLFDKYRGGFPCDYRFTYLYE